ncbi:unnamed protein product [Clavelina lepadiformis]|uniref:Uncharacterized protein n=1 Tax=Clavelina lepadiformis TaxID=159417 RepID=A0ABP0F4I4_CLALP
MYLGANGLLATHSNDLTAPRSRNHFPFDLSLKQNTYPDASDFPTPAFSNVRDYISGLFQHKLQFITRCNVFNYDVCF